MKNKLLRIASEIGLLVFFFCLAGCHSEETKVQREDDADAGLVITGQVTDEQWVKIKRVLDGGTETEDALPRKKLYRIRHYVSEGQTPKEFGDLDEKLLIEDFPDEGFKGYAIQIGFGRSHFKRYPKTTPTPTPGDGSPKPSATPRSGHAHFIQNMTESKTMIDAVDKILNPSPSPSP